MRILLTGGLGYIGSVVWHRLREAGRYVRVLDDESTGNPDSIQCGFYRVNLEDRERVRWVFLQESFDVVIHLAAKALVGESVQDPHPYWRTNIEGTLNLLEAMNDYGCRKILFASSAAVYGEPESVPVPEEHPLRPCNPYGATKAGCEYMIESYCRAYGFAGASLRLFNVAGATADCGERRRHETHLIPLCLDVAANRKDHIDVFGRFRVRDYVHVLDVAEAFRECLNHLRPGRHQVWNIGRGVGTEVQEIIAQCESITGRIIPTRRRPAREGDPLMLVANISKAERELGWRPKFTLTQIIESAWNWRVNLPTPD